MDDYTDVELLQEMDDTQKLLDSLLDRGDNTKNLSSWLDKLYVEAQRRGI